MMEYKTQLEQISNRIKAANKVMDWYKDMNKIATERKEYLKKKIHEEEKQ